MTKSHLEYEANIFAAQLLLPDDEVKEMVYNGFNSQKIAQATGSEINPGRTASALFRRVITSSGNTRQPPAGRKRPGRSSGFSRKGIVSSSSPGFTGLRRSRV